MTGPTAVAAVVKADAYGMGADTVAPALAEAGCDTFFVARLQEGVNLRKRVPRARIFVLDGAHPGHVPALLSHRSDPGLWAAWPRSPHGRRRARVEVGRRWMRCCMSIPA